MDKLLKVLTAVTLTVQIITAQNSDGNNDVVEENNEPQADTTALVQANIAAEADSSVVVQTDSTDSTDSVEVVQEQDSLSAQDSLIVEEEEDVEIVEQDSTNNWEMAEQPKATETQFVVLRVEAWNGDAEVLRWLTNVADKRQNPDSSDIKMTFFVNALNMEKNIKVLKKAHRKNHEIANHTYSHFLDFNDEKIDARLLDEIVWYEEIKKNDSLISKKLGIPKKDIVGFMAPRFEYNENTFTSLSKLKYLYDASIQEIDFIAPYDLEDGSASDSIWTVEKKMLGFKSAGKTKGLWEIPATQWIIPHDSLAEIYGFEAGLRERCFAVDTTFDTSSAKITGVDFRILGDTEIGGLEMNAAEILATIKYNFDCAKDNNIPFSFQITSELYCAQNDRITHSAGRHSERRKIIEDAVDYMLSFDELRFVSAIELVEIMKKEVKDEE